MRSHRVDISGLLAGGRQLMVVDRRGADRALRGDRISGAGSACSWSCVRRTGCCTSKERVDARAHGACDACLEDVDLEVHVDVDERLDPSHGRDDDPFGESNVLTGERLDVADLAQQIVLSVLPMGLRCKEDCHGLCGICGANRNTGECSCDRAQ